MGYDAGFTIYPPLTSNDQPRWKRFLDAVKHEYHDDDGVVTEDDIIFQYGESPRLPLDCTKFRCFSSKISGSCGDVIPYIKDVYELGRQYGLSLYCHDDEDGFHPYSFTELEDPKSVREQLLTLLNNIVSLETAVSLFKRFYQNMNILPRLIRETLQESVSSLANMSSVFIDGENNYMLLESEKYTLSLGVWWPYRCYDKRVTFEQGSYPKYILPYRGSFTCTRYQITDEDSQALLCEITNRSPPSKSDEGFTPGLDYSFEIECIDRIMKFTPESTGSIVPCDGYELTIAIILIAKDELSQLGMDSVKYREKLTLLSILLEGELIGLTKPRPPTARILSNW